MPDHSIPPRPKQGFDTRLSHVGRTGKGVRGFVNPPVARGSTVLSANIAERLQFADRKLDQVLIYGLDGGATHHALEDMVAEIEGGTRCQIVSSGLAAVTTPLLAYLSAGDHLLVVDSCYGPTRKFCDRFLARMGIETTYYPPDIDEAGLTALLRPNTRVVLAESPGSHTFEVQDVPALARAAHAWGAPGQVTMILDNTWGFHFFQPFAHGVDVSIQALTKYAGGHSDLLLGGIIVNDATHWERIRTTAGQLGHYASPDDCWLALRGLRTLGVRLRRQMESGIEIARFLADRPEVARVLHPALPDHPGHAIWQRDFSGASSLFGVVFKPEYSVAAVHAFCDSLQLFGIGASWGGFESLVLPSTGQFERKIGQPAHSRPMARLHIGLEDPADLTADLEGGLAALRATSEHTVVTKKQV